MILEIEDVVVYVKVIYFCVKCCGVKDMNSYIVILVFGGVFLDDCDVCKEFLILIKK